ncbi:MAG: hypothetical protein MR916_00560 [Eubacterium sp.]|nr:hypothetical protein [Eubacterium sp.]
MKALKEFDYNLWTTEENGVKKYFVGVKATGEVTEVDAEVMKVLRNEEKKMRRHIEEEQITEDALLVSVIDRFLYAQSRTNRNIFIRRYWYLCSIRDIADSYKMSESKVKSLLFCMRNELRKNLEKEGIYL